jgi:hypothetical protein
LVPSRGTAAAHTALLQRGLASLPSALSDCDYLSGSTIAESTCEPIFVVNLEQSDVCSGRRLSLTQFH